MRKFLIITYILISQLAISQEVEVVKFSALQKKMLLADSELTVFNFWATWCGPCIKEIPHFETYANDPRVKVVLVSLDFPDQLQKVNKFVSTKAIKSEVLLLNENDYDSYMSKVSPEWSGAIPATLFIDGSGKTYFHEKEFTKEDLDNTIKKYLN